MDEHQILDRPEPIEVDVPARLTAKRNRRLIIALVFAVLGIVTGPWLPTFEGSDLAEIIGAFTVGAVIWSAVIALVVALFPYKKLSYGLKYKRAFALTLVSLEGFLTIGGLLTLIMQLIRQSIS